jgi:hypothetical protein
VRWNASCREARSEQAGQEAEEARVAPRVSLAPPLAGRADPDLNNNSKQPPPLPPPPSAPDSAVLPLPLLQPALRRALAANF